MKVGDTIVGEHDIMLVTGANGFIGSRVVGELLNYGFGKVRCFVRPSSNLTMLRKMIRLSDEAKVEMVEGNLLSRDDCKKAIAGAAVVFHLAAGRGDKSYAGSFMNSVVTTRNLLDAGLEGNSLKRFVNISSFAVYSNETLRRGEVLDEGCPIEADPVSRGEAYCYAKVKQDEMVLEYNRKHGVPYAIIRPGAVYGPGNKGMSGRVGVDTFGVFLHLGGSNSIPLSYVENCAEAIVLAGIKKGADGHVFNVVDDDLPTSREFLRLYKKEVKKFSSIYLPKPMSYLLCYLWEKYSGWSKGQLPPAFNRKRWSADWKGNAYSNRKLKELLGWKQKVGFNQGVANYFKYCRENGR
jgi:nucleoside-diphosphate-sugar epimerase